VRALTVRPGTESRPEVRELPDPEPHADELLVAGVAVGVCGTDREIASGRYGWAPPGEDDLVIGHESLGRVLQAPDGSGFSAGDLVAGVVRRPDPVPCGACAAGQFDMCRNGRYRERGIKELHGYASERWTVPVDYAVGLDAALGLTGVLMEPTSVVAKAWDEVEHVGERAWFDPRRVLVTGAGPVGLLAALLGAQRGLEVHVLDVVTGGLKPRLVEQLGGTYHHDPVDQVAAALRPDVVIEATGVGEVVFGALAAVASYGIVCLTGVSSGGHALNLDAGSLNREMVLENTCVVGSVNANLRHYRAAAEALGQADQAWLDQLITRRIPLSDADDALVPSPEDVKVVITMDDA
jgi:threonine dehydrogenase-like Zn-dependent dehydrogenase